MTDPRSWTLTERDAEMLREMKCPVWLGPVPECETPEDARRLGLEMRLGELLRDFAGMTPNSTESLGELLGRKGHQIEMAWEVCKARWLETHGHEPHGPAN